jgi:hypothetical protein
MARGRKLGDEEPQEEMTVVVLRFKGSSQTLQKSFDAVSQALGALGPVQQHPARLQRRELPAGQAGNGNGGAVDVDADGLDDLDDEPDDEGTEDNRPARSSATRSRVRYQFLSDFDLSGNGTPWKEFAAQKNPQTEYDKYLLASRWIQKHGGCETFTANHAFTCFRAMSWNTLADFTQPMRMLKQRKSYYDVPVRGQWKLNAHGLEAAEAVGTAAN